MKSVIIALCCIILIAAAVKRYVSAPEVVYDGDGAAESVKVVSLVYRVNDGEKITYGNGYFHYLLDEGEGIDKTYKCDDEFENALDKITEKYNINNWTDLTESDDSDGQNEKIEIILENGAVINLGAGYEMPENGWDAMNEINELFESYMDEHGAQPCVGSEIIPADDTGMTLAADYCVKKTATVGGNGYTEIVLWHDESDDTYELHTYSRYDNEENEEHHAYTASQECADEVMNLIDELKLADYRGKKGVGSNGAEYVVRFRQNDETIRISTDNLGVGGANKLKSVGDLMYSYIRTESAAETVGCEITEE